MVVNSSHFVSKASLLSLFSNWTLADLLSVRIHQTVDPLSTRVCIQDNIYKIIFFRDEVDMFFFSFKGKVQWKLQFEALQSHPLAGCETERYPNLLPSKKKKSLSSAFDLAYEICSRIAFHIILHCSNPTAGLMTAVNYKMADLSRGVKKRGKESGGEECQKHTLVT